MVRPDVARLDQMFCETDPAADAISAAFLERHGTPAQLFRLTVAGRYDDDELDDPDVRAWLDERPPLPDWADAGRLANGSRFFAEWGVELGLGLFLSSLPLAYASRSGVQVLALTARLETDTKRRILESAQFVLDVTDRNALEPGATGYEAARMVRLMHAGVRHLIGDEHRVPHVDDPDRWPRWDSSWGEPINQQHLLGAMISYSASLLHVLDRFDVDYDREGAEDYCLLWNTVGWLLGIDPSILPLSRAELDRLEVEIRERNEAESDAGRCMTAALLELVRSWVHVPGLKGYPPTVVRALIGAETADLIGVPPANWTRVLIDVGSAESHRISLRAARHRIVRAILAWVSTRTLRGFVGHERQGVRPRFRIPDHLAARIS